MWNFRKSHEDCLLSTYYALTSMLPMPFSPAQPCGLGNQPRFTHEKTESLSPWLQVPLLLSGAWAGSFLLGSLPSGEQGKAESTPARLRLRRLPPAPDLFCNRTFDDYACWPDGSPGSFVNVSCPWYLPWANSGESPSPHGPPLPGVQEARVGVELA